MIRLTLILIFLSTAVFSESCKITLDDAIISSLRYNYLLQAEKLSEMEGGARVKEAWGRFWPEVVLTGEFADSSVNTVFGSSINPQGTIVEGRQIFFDFDAVFNLKERQHQLLALKYGVDDFVDNLIFDVRRAYYLVAVSLANVHVQEENVQLLEEQVEREQGRYDAGSSTQFEVDQAQVATANALTQLFAARRDYKNNQSILAGLMGLDASQARCVEPDVQEIPWKDYPLIADKVDFLRKKGDPDNLWSAREKEWWLDRMYQGRSDLKEHEALIAAAGSSVNRRQSEYLPKIDGFARHVNLSNNSFGTNLIAGDDAFWETGVAFRWSLFDGFARRHRVREAKLQRCKEITYYQKALQDATIGLQDRFDDIEEAAQAYLAVSYGVTVAEDGVERALGRRDLGAITPLEYRDAVNQLTDARQRELRAAYALLASYFALRRDTGLDRLEGTYRCL